MNQKRKLEISSRITRSLCNPLIVDSYSQDNTFGSKSISVYIYLLLFNSVRTVYLP